MKGELSSLDLHYLIRELKVVEDSMVDRVYHSKENPQECMVAFHVKDKGKHYLKMIIPKAVFLEESKESYDVPSEFCLILRKYLERSRLTKISQHDFERILFMEFDSKIDGKELKLMLIVELFSRGNIILAASDYTIIAALQSQHSQGRTIKRSEKYVFPSKQKYTGNISQEEFSRIISSSDRQSVVKALAIELSLGGTYAEELCHRADTDKKISPAELTKLQMHALYFALGTMLKQELTPNLVDNQIFPFELEIYKDSAKKHYATFSSAISENLTLSKFDRLKLEHDANIAKIQNIIDSQHKSLEDIETEYDQMQAIGEAIYQNYAEVDEIIKVVRKAREKYSWKEIAQKVKSEERLKRIIKEIDEKNAEIIIDLEQLKNK